ncbi:MAG: hypothetical protein AAF487_03980 [Bacteroidota bacterium]
MNRFIYLFVFVHLLTACHNDKPGSQSLHGLEQNWKLSRLGSNEKMKVEIPATVHTVLYKEGLINHPYQDDEEQNIEWIENEDWAFTTWFKTSDRWFDYDRIELNCKGLDTYAKIILNDEEILEANNMFRTWSIDLKPHLKSGRNSLKIVFNSAISEGNIEKQKLAYTLPTSDADSIDQVASFVRKAPYHFGWDWGPRIITAGIWKDIEILGWKKFKVENISVDIKEINADQAQLSARFDIDAAIEGKVYVRVDSKEADIQENFVAYFLEAGSNERSFDFSIPKPKLWWPNGMGDQFLYSLNFSFSSEPDMKSKYTEQIKTGLRKIKLIQQNDSIGKTFQFNINNNNFFAKGANYIPQEVLLDDLKDASYERLLLDMKNSNFNMVRVWGGGIYERDLFYDLCDSLGILVWQDFMFACAMYPGDEDFLDNVSAEVKEQCIRLQNHPSLALWCGNNEVDVAWKNWGWPDQFGYNYAQQSKIYRDYEVIFKEIIPEIVGVHDPDVAYVHTSPLSNWGKSENFDHSSMHYWGVWHGEQPFENVKSRIPRFMAEYGFQSFPSKQTLAEYISSANLDLSSETMSNRQKSYKGNGLIVKHLEEYFPKTTDFNDFIYKSQLTQAKYMDMAINTHRVSNKRCSGTLFWQLNDCWPGPSWSTIDYSGKWKAAQYRVKDRYAPVILVPKQTRNKIDLLVDSDERSPRDIKVIIKLKDFSGTVLFQDSVESTVIPDQDNYLKSLFINQLIPAQRKGTTYLQVQIWSDDRILDEELIFFNKEKYLALEPFEYTHAITSGDTILVELRSSTLIKNAELIFPMNGNFTNNFMDIEADSTYTIGFVPKEGESFKTELRIKALNPN